MSVPREPIPETPPMPGPVWTPEPPIEEPDPDRLPDEIPVPNPDENEEPPKHAEITCLKLTGLQKNIRLSSLTSSCRKSATVRTRTRSRALS